MIDLGNVERYRENNRIEAKKALGGLPGSIWETYSAFANTLGGVILLGVEEYRDKTFHVVDLPCPERLVAEFKEKLSDRKYASINILSDKDITIEDFEGKRFIAINVPRAHRFDKPVFSYGSMANGTYRRGGEGDYRCKSHEIEAMLRDAKKRSFDMDMTDFDVSVLCFKTVHAYRERFSEVHPEHMMKEASDNEFLLYAGAVSEDENKCLHPTSAGLLMFGKAKEIKKMYPYFSPFYTEKNDEGSTVLSYMGENLFDFYLKVKERIERGICMFGLSRAEEISVAEAVEEALINSVVHADYGSQSCVNVEFSPYYMSVTNPGSLRISPDMILKSGGTDRRNALVSKIFSLVGVGTYGGIRGIYEIWRRKKWCAPVLREGFAPEKVTLFLTFGEELTEQKSSSVPTESRIIAVIDYVTEHIEVNAEEIAALLGVEAVIVGQILNELVLNEVLIKEVENGNENYKLKA